MKREGWWRPSGPALLVIIGTAVLAGVHLWFWLTHRRDMSVFIDEAGYGVFSLDDAQAYRNGGLTGLWDAFQNQRVYAPLVPLLGAPIHVVFGDSLTGSWLVVLFTVPVLAAATYLIALRLMPAWWAAGAALVTVCVPEILMFSRTILFSIPAAAFYVGAIACLLRSRGLLDRRWAAAGGALLGLTALSRTMMLAFVAGPVLAVTVQALASKTELRRRATGLALTLFAGIGVAALWYGKHLSEVVSYLQDNPFIRGNRSNRSGPPLLRDVGQVLTSFQAALAIVLLVAVGTGVVLWFRRRRGGRAPRDTTWPARAQSFLTTDTGVVVLCLLQGVIVLRVARSAGGQWVPLLPLIVVLAVAVIARLPTRARSVFAAALVAVSTFNLVAQSDVIHGLGAPHGVSVDPFGPVELVDGRQYFERRLEEGRWPTGRAGRLPDVYREWVVFNDRVVRTAVSTADANAQRPVLFLAGGASYPLNTNTLLLSDRLMGDRHSLLVGILPTRDAREARQYINDPAFGFPNLVILPERDRRPSDGSQPTPREIAMILRTAGFEVVDRFDAPDGRPFSLWWRSPSDELGEGEGRD